MTPKEATVLEMVDALLLFNEPILNHRFHEMLARQAADATGTDVSGLPGRIVASELAAREAAVIWQQVAGGGRALNEQFLLSGTLALTESFLDLANSQTRLLTFMARHAPTREVREGFEEAAEGTRGVAGTLRGIAEASAGASSAWRQSEDGRPLRLVQEEEVPPGDLRGQVEDAIRACRAAGREPRRLLVSHTALRHLRDQGCFARGGATLLGVRVDVDLGWDNPAFALETYEVVPLDEILGNGGTSSLAQLESS